MSVSTITTSAKDVGRKFFDGAISTAKWGAHKVGDAGGFLRDKAAVIMNLVKGFFKNIPQYFSVVRSHAGTFIQHIRNNKANSAGIAGLTLAATFGALAIFKHLTKDAV
ncbi:MAG: hypothetical protein KR126chlam4_01280 [Candidatus Anoxychlamydiales bacterium]|nr:hypothetical protein [Candidatus Anoxychlamydiales bacterium]NGX41439.1 hypothetical protein [Candidatus Anoxychlamydiales bacterium]HEU64755.1 hypothetical protein [Chlamydiota bacterium]